MQYRYQAYGLLILSEVALPGLAEANDDAFENDPIRFTFGPVENALRHPPLVFADHYSINESELWHFIPGIMKYYVANGTQIVIESLCENRDDLLVYAYSNCLAAALLQRGLIPLHVSGVWIDEHRVFLFAAPSQTGKSTLSVQLQERGYHIFTDDTSLLTIQENRCLAQASYPMLRLWQDTIGQQSVFDERDKQRVFSGIEKYGFWFHEQFCTERVVVAGIAFLEKSGVSLIVSQLTPVNALSYLSRNVYRAPWVQAMRKQKIQFQHLCAIAAIVPAWRVNRPETTPTFAQFPDFIIDSLITPLLSSPGAIVER